MKPWVARSASAEPEPTSAPVSRLKVSCMIFYLISQAILIRAVSILGIIGLVLARGKAPFQLNQPVVLCLGTALAYRFVMNLVISDSGKYMTGVYLCYLPFAANTLWALSQRWRQSESRQKAAVAPAR
jgi:hypothetical protein